MIDKHLPTISHEDVEKSVDIVLYGRFIGPIVSWYRKRTGKLLYK